MDWKTYPSKREKGDFTSILLSPIADARNADTYSNMRKVNTGDVVLHIDQDTNVLVGYTQASSTYDIIEIDGKQLYCINLVNYTSFNSIIDIDIVLSDTLNQQAFSDIKESGQETFFQDRKGKYYLRQGGYLTSLSKELYNLITNSAFIPITTIAENDVIDNDDRSYPEGRKSYYLHKKKERSRKLVNDAKKKFKEKNNGRVFCECCNFDFLEAYGDIGEDFIEAHHSIPINQINEDHESKVSDIVLLCSNCHRMVHRGRPILLEVSELQDRMD